MKNEHVTAITEKLELLNKKQLETIRKEVESFIESKPNTQRKKLFKAVKDVIYGIGDISIENEFCVCTGIGANLIYDESKDENVSLCYMVDEDIIELHVNNESVLQMDDNSPILEALQELFKQIELGTIKKLLEQ